MDEEIPFAIEVDNEPIPRVIVGYHHIITGNANVVTREELFGENADYIQTELRKIDRLLDEKMINLKR